MHAIPFKKIVDSYTKTQHSSHTRIYIKNINYKSNCSHLKNRVETKMESISVSQILYQDVLFLIAIMLNLSLPHRWQGRPTIVTTQYQINKHVIKLTTTYNHYSGITQVNFTPY